MNNSLIDTGKDNSKLSTEIINSYLLLAYLFANSITLPLKDLTNSGVPVYFFIGIIVTVSIFVNRNKSDFKTIFLILILLILIFLNTLVVSYKTEATHWMIEFLKFGIIPLYLASTKLNLKQIFDAWTFFGIINFFIWVFYFKDVNDGKIDYMFYGVSLTYSFSIFIINLLILKYKRILFLFFTVISYVMLILLANRVAVIIATLLIILFLLYRSLKTKAYRILSLIILILSYVIYKEIFTVLLLVKKVTDNFGFNSYFLNKAIFLMNNGIEAASSGRDNLYVLSLEILKNSSYLPNGIGYFQYKTGEIYPHNIFLDLMVSFGFLGILIFLSFTLWVIVNLYKYKDNKYRLFVISLIVIVSIRLMFSGTYITEIPLWITIGILFNQNFKKSLHKEKNLRVKY